MAAKDVSGKKKSSRKQSSEKQSAQKQGAKKTKNKDSKAERYTDPALRERLKKKIKAGDKGGKKGQWSARKAQLLVKAYEKRGGGYTAPKDEDQQHLSEWTAQEWQTRDGESKARSGGTTKRYLPKQAWEALTPQQQAETERAKTKGSRAGRQHVANPPAAKAAGARARGADGDEAPVAAFDAMTVAQARQALGGLDGPTLHELREYERRNKNRSTLLAALDRLLAREERA